MEGNSMRNIMTIFIGVAACLMILNGCSSNPPAATHSDIQAFKGTDATAQQRQQGFQQQEDSILAKHPELRKQGAAPPSQ
jgi:starvation-inducible outer membrane lipoprotein